MRHLRAALDDGAEPLAVVLAQNETYQSLVAER